MIVEVRDLAKRWASLRDASPNVRTRDAADELGVSEAELVSTMVGADAVRLATEPDSLLHALTEVGRCMALTRNDSAVSEVRGRYGGIELGEHAGRVFGEHIDLRVALDEWTSIFALDEQDPHRTDERRRSIHVFDRTGTAVHKIYLEPEGNYRTWDAVVASRTITAPLVIEHAPVRADDKAARMVESEVFQAGWDAMTGPHDLADLLAQYGFAYPQALRIAGESRARAVRNNALDHVLHEAAETGDEIVISVPNRGCTQIFAGSVQRIVRQGPWLNVLDPALNLHLRSADIASSWVVAKPSRHGVTRSLELLDASGETIVVVSRKYAGRGRTEDPAWRKLLDRLADAERR